MSHATDEMKQAAEHSLQAIKTLRDEIRVRIHLAGMEAKEAWHKLSDEAEHLTREAGGASHQALTTMVEKLEKLAASLKPDHHQKTS